MNGDQGWQKQGGLGDIVPSSPKETPYHGMIATLRKDDFDPRVKGSDRIDENAVRRIAYLMLQKMQHNSDKGKTGWWNEKACAHHDLLVLCEKAIKDADWISLANYAMMLEIRRELKNGPRPIVYTTR